ncbi:MAG: PAS domain S-box protein [Ramlibacter sp.]
MRTLLVLLVVAAILPLLVFSLYRAASQADIEIERAKTNLELTVSIAAINQEKVAESARLLLTAMISLPELRRGGQLRCGEYFDVLRDKFPAYANFGLIDHDGYVRCHSLDAPGHVFVGDRGYFQEAVASRGFSVSAFQIGRLSGQKVVVFALPLLDAGGKVVAVAFAALNLREFERSLEGAQLSPGSRIAILDRGGVVLATTNPSFPAGKQVVNPEVLAAIRARRSLVDEGPDAQGKSRIYAVTPGRGIAQNGLFVLASIDRDLVVARSRHWLAGELLLILLVATVGSVAAWVIAGITIAGPASQILKAILLLRRGRLDARVSTKGIPLSDEFSRMADGFNLMAESLEMRRKDLETELSHSRQAYDTLDLVLNSMQEALVAVDRHGQVLLKNQAASVLLDLEASLPDDETWARRHGVYIPGTDQHMATQALPLQRALRGETGRNLDIEVRNSRLRGARVLRCSYRPVRAGDKVLGALMVMSDITDIRNLQIEQALSLTQLKEAQRRLLEAQEIGRIGSWEMSLPTQRLWWSDEVHVLMCIDKSDFDGSMDAMLRVVHPDDREEFIRKRDLAMNEGRALEMEYRIICPDGAVRWIHQIGRLYVDDFGVPVRRAGVVQDITARKTAQAELLLLRNAISRINDAVLITEAQPIDEPGPRIVYANQAIERMSGYSPDQLIGRSPRILQGAQTGRDAKRRLRQALETRQPIRLELINHDIHDQPYWVEIDISPLFQADGELTHFISVQRDVSARKQAELALQVSERRYAALFEQGPLPMWVFDRQTARFMAVNEAALAQYGYSREEFDAMTLYDIRPESERARLARQLVGPPPAAGTTARLVHKRKDGSEFPVDVVARPIPYYGESAMFVVAIDVSARVTAEAEVQGNIYTLQRAADAAQIITQQTGLPDTLNEVVEQARAVIGAHQAIISVVRGGSWHESANVASLSDKYARWQGVSLHRPDVTAILASVFEGNRPVRLTQDELQAHPLWRDLAGDDGHPPMRGWLAVRLTGADGRNIGLLQLSDRYEGEFSVHDEYVVTELAHLAAAAVEKAALIEEVRALNTDLEAKIQQRTLELVRQEALFRALAEQAPQLVWTVNTRGEATYVNRYWYTLVGRQPPHGLGQTWMEEVHPDDRAAIVENWRRSREERSVFAGVRRLRAADGTFHTMSYRAAPVLNAGGDVDFWAGIDTDITELKTYEEALKRSNEELEAFSYSVSHDLRAPLQAVDGFTRLLMRELPPDLGGKSAHYLQRIQAGVERMGRMIEDLLSLAQVSRVPMRFRLVDLSGLAREVLDELQVAAPNAQAVVKVQDGLEAQCDPRLFRLVLQNLLANAWKFSARKERAEIEFGRDESGAYFVRDNGAGFNMAYANKLFGAFQRLHTEREFPGTGVGLATVKRIIERHQGRVWAYSGPEGGATFYFTLHDDSLPPVLPVAG